MKVKVILKYGDWTHEVEADEPLGEYIESVAPVFTKPIVFPDQITNPRRQRFRLSSMNGPLPIYELVK